METGSFCNETICKPFYSVNLHYCICNYVKMAYTRLTCIVSVATTSTSLLMDVCVGVGTTGMEWHSHNEIDDATLLLIKVPLPHTHQHKRTDEQTQNRASAMEPGAAGTHYIHHPNIYHKGSGSWCHDTFHHPQTKATPLSLSHTFFDSNRICVKQKRSCC